MSKTTIIAKALLIAKNLKQEGNSYSYSYVYKIEDDDNGKLDQGDIKLLGVVNTNSSFQNNYDITAARVCRSLQCALFPVADYRCSGRPGYFLSGTRRRSGETRSLAGTGTPQSAGQLMLILIDNYDSFTYNIVQMLGTAPPGALRWLAASLDER